VSAAGRSRQQRIDALLEEQRKLLARRNKIQAEINALEEKLDRERAAQEVDALHALVGKKVRYRRSIIEFGGDRRPEALRMKAAPFGTLLNVGRKFGRVDFGGDIGVWKLEPDQIEPCDDADTTTVPAVQK
jgi:hypothetical protein